ncbi:MAG TPA: hypothetical protein PKY19_04525 [Oscillospiraceae bacterium]|nr:hypothetical protein [Oscillospiraceae bacterium]HXK77731.1 hypothetical protein [Oscillospiraceae bacterium]
MNIEKKKNILQGIFPSIHFSEHFSASEKVYIYSLYFCIFFVFRKGIPPPPSAAFSPSQKAFPRNPYYKGSISLKKPPSFSVFARKNGPEHGRSIRHIYAECS